MFKEAITLLQEGVNSGEKGSSDGRFYFHLGDALNRIGKPQEVRRCNITYCLCVVFAYYQSINQSINQTLFIEGNTK